MKRFDPQVGSEGRGKSAGRNHRSLQRLLRNAAAISLFAAPIFAPTFLNAQAINLSSSSPYTQNFDTLANTGTANTWTDGSTITGWYAQRSGTGTTYAADTGSTSSGGLYSFGATSSTDRALGSIGSGGATAGNFAYGVVFKNNTTNNISFTSIAYDLEQWRLGQNAAKSPNDTITFWYKISSSATTALTPGIDTNWTAITALDAVAPVNGGTAGALAGNTNKTSVSSTSALSGVTVSAGNYITFRWSDPDHSGSDHGTAIDNFSLSYGYFEKYWVGNSGTWSSSSTTFAATSGGTTGASQSTTEAIIFDAINITPSVSGTVTVAAGLTFSANGISISAGTINLSGLTAAANAIAVTNAGDTATIGSTISGSNGLTMSGPGKLILTGTNTLTGVVTLTGGTLRATAAGALGAGSASLAISSGTLELANNTATSFGRNTTISGDVTIKSDTASSNAGVIQTLGTLAIGANTLTIDKGSNATGTTSGVTFGAVTLSGAPIFTVNTGSLLTLASVTGTAQNITVTGAGDTTVSGAIATTTGNLTKSGNGILTLNGANTFTGGLTINAGTVKLGSTGALNSTANSQNAVTFGSASNGTLSINGISVTIASLNTDTGNAGSTTVQNGSASTNATLTIGNSTNAPSTFAGIIQNGSTGTLALNKAGTGILTLTAANTYTGGTTLNAGTIKLSGSGALAGGTVAIGGGTLSVVNAAGVDSSGGALTGTSNSIAGNVNLNSGIIDLTAGSLSVGGALSLSGGNIKYTLGKTLAVTGQLTLSAPVNVSLDGTYAVGKIYTLLSYSSSSPAPDFANNFRVTFLNNTLGKWSYNSSESSAGVYKITLTSLANNLNWNLVGAGEWGTSSPANWLNTTTAATQAFTEGDNVTFDKSTGGVITVSGTVTPSTIIVNNSAGNYTFQTGIIAGDGGITKSGNGKLTLSATNTFKGEVLVNAGTLAVTNVNALGATTAGTTITSGATLDVSGGITLAVEPLTIAGAGVGGVGALTSSSGSNTIAGPITLNGDTLITSQGTSGTNTLTLFGALSGSSYNLTIGGAADTIISGNITGTGLALNKTGNGTLTLSNATNSYTGLTTVTAGTLVANNAASISSSASVASGAVLNLKDNKTLVSLAGSGEVRIADGKTFTLDNSTTLNFGGTFTATNGTAFTKQGSGTLNLSGASISLARDITLSAGTIKASNNNALGTGAIKVSAGNIYVGNGNSIRNDITIGTAAFTAPVITAAGWDFNGTTTTTAVSNLAASTVGTQGVGYSLTVGALSKSASITAGTGVANKFGPYSNWSTTQSDLSYAVTNNKYLGFSITTNSDITLPKLSLTEIMAYRNQHSGTGPANITWKFSTDNWVTSTSLGDFSTGSFTNSTGNDMAKIDNLSTYTGLQNLAAGTKVDFRIYGWGSTGSSGTFYLLDDGTTAIDFGVNGKVGTDTVASGSGTLGIDDEGSATFTGNVVVNNTATLTAASKGTAVFQGVISGAGSITKTGDGIVELKGLNTFTGPLTLTAGNLKVSSLAAVGVASPLGQAADDVKTIIFNGGKFEYAGTVKGVFNRDFTVGSGGAGFISSGTAALEIGPTAQMDFQDTTSGYRILSLGGTSDPGVENIFNPTKIDSADVTKLFNKLVKQDTNKWIVQGAGAGFVDDAAIEINGGELDFAMGALGLNSTINVGSATLGWYGTHTDDISDRIYLNNNSAVAAFNVQSGIVTLNSAFNGGAVTSASLTKLGDGTLELGGTNKFSGGLTVSAGTVKALYAGAVGSGTVSVSRNATFVVNAILANKINVKSGGTLAGTGGTDEDTTIEEDGILSPNGTSVGRLSFNKLTLNGGAKVQWQLQDATKAAGLGYDTLIIETLNLSNAISTKKKIIVEVTSSGLTPGFDKTKVNKFEFAKIATDLANGVNVTDLFSFDVSQFETENNLKNDHLVWSMQYAADRDMMYITTMIPEPSTYGLGLSALALAVVAVRRRKKKKI